MTRAELREILVSFWQPHWGTVPKLLGSPTNIAFTDGEVIRIPHHLMTLRILVHEVAHIVEYRLHGNPHHDDAFHDTMNVIMQLFAK